MCIFILNYIAAIASIVADKNLKFKNTNEAQLFLALRYVVSFF